MPFLPLPRSVTDLLEQVAADGGLAVEFGCGDGRVNTLFRDHGVRLVGIDLLGRELGHRVAVVGDALRPPLLPGSVQLLVAANLVRHLLAAEGSLDFLRSWFSLLAPAGRLLILEDEPTPDRPASRNYLKFQEFLQELSVERRGGLLELSRFLDLLPADDGHYWDCGQQPNRYPLDQDRVLGLLRGEGNTRLSGEVARLVADIENDGMDYGDYWWAIRPWTDR